MELAIIAVIIGLALLVWSADRFVEGATAVARYCAVSPLLIGIVVVGFGTSAPEMVISTLAAFAGNPGIALGNAYGSNITNMALILGITALISPIMVPSTVVRKELPILTLLTLVSAILLADFYLSRLDACILLLLFVGLMTWTIYQGLKRQDDVLAEATSTKATAPGMPIKQALFWLTIGLLILIASSRILIWGAVAIAEIFGISDLIIGLTIVALGTSLPELASSLIAVRKGVHGLALGNVIGSNLFNTLAVVGIAGSIHPFAVESEILSRDIAVMAALTVSLFLIGYGYKGRQGHINRFAGAALLLVYVSYTTWLMRTALHA